MKFEFDFQCKPRLTVSDCFRDSDNQEIMDFIKMNQRKYDISFQTI